MTQDDQQPNAQTVDTHNQSSTHNNTKYFLPIVGIVAVSLMLVVVYINIYVKQLLLQQSQQTRQQYVVLQQSTQQTLQQFQEEAQERVQGINDTFNQLLKDQHTQPQPSNWILFKARYYLELASINNIWTDDNQTTLALLQEADTLLATVQQENMVPVRQAIADERAALLAIPNLDVTGILSTLQTLQQTVDTMQPLFETTTAKTQTTTTKSFSQLTWREHFQQALQTLRSLVIVQHHDESLSAYMTPTYVAMQRAAIRLHLAEAEAAVMQRQTEVYQLMLKQVRDNLVLIFDPNQDKTKAMLNLLDTLQAVKFTHTKPSLAISAQRLNQIIQTESVETTTEQAT